MNYKVERVNQMFLITILVSLVASFLPISALFPSYASRILFSQVILATPGAVYLIASKQNYARAVQLKKIRISTVFWLILFTVCVMPVMTFVNAVSMLFVENSTTSMMSQVTTQNSWLFSMCLIALVPAVFEESVYRGLFYQEYRKVAPVKGMLLSAFLFGIMHGNLNQFSYAFLMGIIFTLVIEATDSILASMIMHFIINGFSVTLLSVYPKLLEAFGYAGTDATGEEVMEQLLDSTSSPATLLGIIRTYLPIALVAGAFAVIVYMVMAAGEGRLAYVKSLFRKKDRSGERISEQDSTQKSNGLLTKPLLAGILICVVLMIVNEFMPG